MILFAAVMLCLVMVLSLALCLVQCMRYMRREAFLMRQAELIRRQSMPKTGKDLSDIRKIVDGLIDSPSTPAKHVDCISAGSQAHERLCGRSGLLEVCDGRLYWGSVPVRISDIVDPSDIVVTHMDRSVTVLTNV